MSEDAPSTSAARPSAFGRLLAFLSAIGTAWIFLLMVLICSDVASRDAFNAPILGVPEMVQFSIVGIVFLQLPQTLRSGGLTRSDVLLSGIVRRWPRGGYAMQCLFDLIAAGLFAVIFAATLPLLQAAFTNAEFYGSTGVVQIPIWPLKLLILIGCTAMASQFLLHAWQDALIALGKRPSAPIQGAPE
ncbi:MAG: TRAP transporter small permease [Burkholderiales bacterium]|nr:TRAP transporter small permease [Burkholderiales bacterium]